MKVQIEGSKDKIPLTDVGIGELFLFEGKHFFRIPTIAVATLLTDEVLRDIVAINIETGLYLCLSKEDNPEVIVVDAVVDIAR